MTFETEPRILEVGIHPAGRPTGRGTRAPQLSPTRPAEGVQAAATPEGSTAGRGPSRQACRVGLQRHQRGARLRQPPRCMHSVPALSLSWLRNRILLSAVSSTGTHSPAGPLARVNPASISAGADKCNRAARSRAPDHCENIIALISGK